jgi:hypothetical protein
MNVNELADELWNWEESLFRDASTMLRQQQAEIERLTMLCDCMTTECNRRGNEIELLKKQIPDWENIRKPNPHIGNLDKEPYTYKMGDIDWTKALK